MTSFALDDHLKKEHKRTPLSAYLKEIVYGGNDGIVTTFAVVAGFSGAQKDPASAIPLLSVLLFGIANLVADGISMGLGNFLSIRADKDVYKREQAKERHEIEHNPEIEFAETIEILKRKKFSDTDAKTLASVYRKNKDYWLEFMMRDELDMQNPGKENPIKTGLATFLSFILFGIIPLLPYLLGFSSFAISVGFTTIALILLGALRSMVSQKKLFIALVETLGIGGIAASAAYFVGTLF